MKLNNKIYINKGIYDNNNIFENTIESIKKGVSINQGLYLTVRETKDHVLVIYEDGNLSRLLNVKDKISDMTYEELLFVSFYHIPTLNEVLDVISGKVDLILNLKIKTKNKEILNLLDNYKGNFIITGSPSIIYRINKEREKYMVGEIITKKHTFSFYNFMIKTDFRSYDVDFFDKLKLNKLKEDNKPLFGYLINTKQKYKEFKDEFDYLIVDNYQNLNIEK